jgi:hypothetical protein
MFALSGSNSLATTVLIPISSRYVSPMPPPANSDNAFKLATSLSFFLCFKYERVPARSRFLVSAKSLI